MVMTVHRHDTDPDIREGDAEFPAGQINPSLSAALALTLDNIATGVVIVSDDMRILHANHAASLMLRTRSPILSLGGHLVALRSDLTNELKQAIAYISQSGYRQSGISVPLINRDTTIAAAHVMPLNSSASLAPSAGQAVATIFVTSASQASRVDLSTVGRTFRLMPAEGRLLGHLVSGKTLREAADDLGITEATATSLQNGVFAKVGVSRLTDLMILIGNLVPPIFQSQ